jgi:hypothetical protein
MPEQKKYFVHLEYSETWAIWADSEEDAITNYTGGDNLSLRMRDVEAVQAPDDYELDEIWTSNA